MGNHTLVILKKGEGRTIKSGGLWIYDNEIESITGTFHNGDMVTVHDYDGYPLGRGYINQNSKIRIRLMTRNAGQEIDEAFLRMRLQNAWDYRKKTMGLICGADRNNEKNEKNEKNVSDCSCRLVFGDADFLPGLVIDKYADVLVVQSLALGIDRFKEQIVTILKEILAADGLVIRGVYERSDSKEREKEGMVRTKGFLGAEFDTKVPISENGVKYLVDVRDGQKTGFFLDQKYNRLAIQKLCRGAKVLDCFTHTGSFALNAGIAGAADVLGVDASELAVAQAQENARLNGLQDTVRFECHDVFELLPELERRGEQYDVVILDPPAFAKSRSSVKNAAKGYREINLRGMKLVKNGGYLATCSCSHFMDYETFTKVIGQAARSAHKRLRQVEFRTQAPDHPILWAADESYYLKFYIFQIVDEK
ncbi:MAG: class I SAM-dependent rRNA methyltransferase [Clostridiales bacterium]|nr:class I SAM-dependent rRNA methyltransferase [Clostridiales bacterium]